MEAERGGVQPADLGDILPVIIHTTLGKLGNLVFIHKMKTAMPNDEIVLINADTPCLPSPLPPTPMCALLTSDLVMVVSLLMPVYDLYINDLIGSSPKLGVLAYCCCVTDEGTERWGGEVTWRRSLS